jgi:hypothetical protein
MRFLLKIILFSSLFFSALLSNININECKSDLYYANGIMIDVKADVAETKWQKKVKKLFINNKKEYIELSKISISYNASQGFFDDVFESAGQVMSNEWGWSEFSGYFRTYLEQKGIQESVNLHRPNLNTQVKAYKQSIKDGHGVIVIAHSQGNYYTNEAYEELDEWMKDYFHMFSVATPANHVAGYAVDDATAPYVTFHNDFINSVVTGLPSNRLDTRHHGFPSVAAHDFYESYLKEETTKNDIFNFILNQIQAHNDAPSQWETDQELKKDTKDYKITVKHRFDSSVVMSEEVYPFAASKKLYHVTDNTGGNGWVKASCGGSEVFDNWTDKKENEFYLINNIEEEKIIAKLEKIIYALATIHPSGNINSTSNQVRVVQLRTELDTLKILEYTILKTLGSFTNTPSLYSMWYSTNAKPVNGHSVLWLYQGTEFEGLSERYMYPSYTLEELASKLTYPVKMASNYANGNLNRNDNFWTNFSPTSSLTDIILGLK